MSNRLKTFYSNSTKKIKIDDNQNCNDEIDIIITIETIKQIKFLNAKNTINTIINQSKKIWNSDASQKQFVQKMNKIVKTMLNDIDYATSQKSTSKLTVGSPSTYAMA